MAFRFYGEVARHLVSNGACFIRLTNVTPEGDELPEAEYLKIPLSHD